MELAVKYYSDESYVNIYAHEASIKTLSILLEESTLKAPQSLQRRRTAHTHVSHISGVKKNQRQWSHTGKNCSDRARGTSQRGFCRSLRSRAWKGATVKHCLGLLVLSLSPVMQPGDPGEKRRPRGAEGGIAARDRHAQEHTHMPHAVHAR